ncbi:cytochrome c maturation protein CcmE [Aquisalinus flavus]|nr:cytochrome c maturation protein CcmE [Aquisalinus flavus]UNE49315.1 cytochrome c maturation protein CcmE [Aquisalinus flavus]
MPRRRRQQRLMLAALIVPALTGAIGLAVIAIGQSQVYFYPPRDLPSASELGGRTVRLGGMVVEGSIQQGLETDTSFKVTDYEKTVTVVTSDMLPGLFGENQGVVVQGTLAQDGTFVAARVMAKHDENYMPAEVADALEDSGRLEDYKNKGLVD